MNEASLGSETFSSWEPKCEHFTRKPGSEPREESGERRALGLSHGRSPPTPWRDMWPHCAHSCLCSGMEVGSEHTSMCVCVRVCLHVCACMCARVFVQVRAGYNKISCSFGSAGALRGGRGGVRDDPRGDSTSVALSEGETSFSLKPREVCAEAQPPEGRPPPLWRKHLQSGRPVSPESSCGRGWRSPRLGATRVSRSGTRTVLGGGSWKLAERSPSLLQGLIGRRSAGASPGRWLGRPLPHPGSRMVLLRPPPWGSGRVDPASLPHEEADMYVHVCPWSDTFLRVDFPPRAQLPRLQRASGRLFPQDAHGTPAPSSAFSCSKCKTAVKQSNAWILNSHHAFRSVQPPRGPLSRCVRPRGARS